MQTRTSIALALTALALGACGNAGTPANRGQEGPDNRVAREDTPPPPERTRPQVPQFGPEEAMAGTWSTRFEHSEFNGCWFEMSPEALADFQRLNPREGAGGPQPGRSWRLRIIGRRAIDQASGPATYGHMGGWRCEIRATRILAAALVDGDRRAAPPEADRTPVDPDVARARKAAGAEPPAFSAGHDRARLEEQRRNMAHAPR